MSKKAQCTFPDCVCDIDECGAEEHNNTKMSLSPGWREQMPKIGVVQKRSLSDIIFALFLVIIMLSGAIGLGFMVALKREEHRVPPDTDFTSRSVHVELNDKDTTRVMITTKSMYLYQTLTDEQKKNLKKSIE